MTSTTTMPCADENFTKRAFAPSDDGDHVCTHCGWMQSSAAGGAAELCNSATWHSQGEYERYANVARAGGYSVPDTAPNLVRN
ncbi:hypothetical protein [Duganella vulcania]|uniref:Uncharacterized protein n=1 Tax=Duganella vulcania TaxID=2692166 RepID=A0A845GGF4_9BURK|nr:hypothetical protein [Duganella vulcania]MYM92590.1 hypothetical protein [Duganella vulcania]